MMTSGQPQTALGSGAPKAFRYARILVAVQITRLLGLILFSGIQSGLLPATAGLFAVGDGFVGVTAIPVWYALGRGGVRTYVLTIAWVTFGLVDLIYAVVDGALGGQLGALSKVFGPGIVAIPLEIVIQAITFVLLLSPSVLRYATRR